MTDTQSSGFHIVETNDNGAQTILYWLLGIFALFVILVGIRVWRKNCHNPVIQLRKKEERQELMMAQLEMEAELDRRTRELGRVGRGCRGRRHSTNDSSPPT